MAYSIWQMVGEKRANCQNYGIEGLIERCEKNKTGGIELGNRFVLE